MFKQKDRMYDYIFPLAVAIRKGLLNYEYSELIGTGFLIGRNGFALTAAHVTEQLEVGIKTTEYVMVALFRSESEWHPYEITGFERHLSEDVAIFKISGGPWQSFFSITDEPEYQGRQFCCYGYPFDIAKEEYLLKADTLDKPDLIYIQGYPKAHFKRTTGTHFERQSIL